MTVQTCLQPGLSAVCTELLDFTGDEIYFSEQPDLVGASYLDAQLSFSASTVIGFVRGDKLWLNPPPDDVVDDGDQLVLIAEDDTSIETTPRGAPDRAAISETARPTAQSQRTLVLGYSSSVQSMLEDLADYVPAGSLATVVADVELSHLVAPRALELQVVRADTTSRAVLEGLGVEAYDHVLVLAYRYVLDTQAADAKTLVTLLHLRDIADRADVRLSIVSEMLDDRNRELAEVTRPDDFIVSDRLASLMLAQVSEHRSRLPVFEELFTTGGNEIYVRPAEWFVKPGVEADFYTVVEAASCRGETAIGYRTAAEAYSPGLGYGVHLNPAKSERRTYAPGDAIIVLAETT